MNQCNILFTSAGRRVTLIRQFSQALKELKVSGKIFAGDASKFAPALFSADHQVNLPLISAPNYIEKLLEICKKKQIKVLIPLIDTELQILSKNRKIFNDQGTTVLVSSENTNDICANKLNTYNFFGE